MPVEFRRLDFKDRYQIFVDNGYVGRMFLDMGRQEWRATFFMPGPRTLSWRELREIAEELERRQIDEYHRSKK